MSLLFFWSGSNKGDRYCLPSFITLLIQADKGISLKLLCLSKVQTIKSTWVKMQANLGKHTCGLKILRLLH